jgi:hypothetical protein
MTRGYVTVVIGVILEMIGAFTRTNSLIIGGCRRFCISSNSVEVFQGTKHV